MLWVRLGLGLGSRFGLGLVSGPFSHHNLILTHNPNPSQITFRVWCENGLGHYYTIGTLDVLQGCDACADTGMTYSVIVQCTDCVVFLDLCQISIRVCINIRFHWKFHRPSGRATGQPAGRWRGRWVSVEWTRANCKDGWPHAGWEL